MGEPFRRCSRCDVNQPISGFYIRKNGQVNPWCKTCYRAWYANRSGGMVDRDCDHCGTTMSVTKRRADGPRVFCSRPCKGKARNAASQATIEAAKPDRRCNHCGDPMARKMRSDAKFCSATCNERAHNTKRKYRVGRDSGDGVVRAEIFERDRWRCGICRKRVNGALQHPHPMSPSLDHVIPRSHLPTGDPRNWDPANLRLAHLSCNISRRDRGGNEQLALC